MSRRLQPDPPMPVSTALSRGRERTFEIGARGPELYVSYFEEPERERPVRGGDPVFNPDTCQWTWMDENGEEYEIWKDHNNNPLLPPGGGRCTYCGRKCSGDSCDGCGAPA